MHRRDITKERRTGLYIHEVNDLRSTLEHLIAVASKARRDQERREEFQEFHQDLLDKQHSLPLDQGSVHDDPSVTTTTNTTNTASTDNAHENDTGQQPQKGDDVVFAEDIRLYGPTEYYCLDGLAMPLWPMPKTRRPPNTSDKEWNIEHGDDIHPLAFSRTRLSTKLPMDDDDDWMNKVNGNNLHVGTTDTSLKVEEVPRALLLRCWERAVHAASMTIPAPTTTTQEKDSSAQPPPDTIQFSGRQNTFHNKNIFEGSILGLGETHVLPEESIFKAAPPPPQEPTKYMATQEKTAVGMEATVLAKCESLGVDLGKNRRRDCPSCTRVFTTNTLLKKHYYGVKGERGCCWRKISKRHGEMIHELLESHVKTQVDLILGIISNKAREKILAHSNTENNNNNNNNHNNNNKKQRRVLNWWDILKFVESAVAESNSVSWTGTSLPGEHPILETLQTKPNATPLTLNPMILETVRRRLIDRYADVAP